MPYIHIEIDSENSFVFETDQQVTVFDLKRNLGRCLNIPSTEFEVCNSRRTFGDQDVIPVGSAHGDTFSEPQITIFNGVDIVCFAQVFNDKPVGRMVDFYATDTCSDPSGSLLASNSSGDLMDAACGKTYCSPSDHSLVDKCGTIKCEPKSSCGMGELDEQGEAPYVDVLPENRQYIVVVSAPCEEQSFCHLLEDFFRLFLEYKKTSLLRFNQETPVVQFQRKLFIMAADFDSMEWVEKGIRDPFKSVSLLEYLNLSLARFVFPAMKSCVLSNLKLLESQNDCLHTDKWAVVERILIKPNDPRWLDGSICDNEEIFVYMDEASIEYINKRCNQLRFCFWLLTFEFC